jgi:hypothetical protein
VADGARERHNPAMTVDIDPLHIIPIIASQLQVAHHQVTGSVENNGEELHVSVSVANVSDAAIQELARELGGTVQPVDIERDKTTTDFIVHDSTVVLQRLAKTQ